MNESTLRYILDNIILLACAEINPGSINRPGPILYSNTVCAPTPCRQRAHVGIMLPTWYRTVCSMLHAAPEYGYIPGTCIFRELETSTSKLVYIYEWMYHLLDWYQVLVMIPNTWDHPLCSLEISRSGRTTAACSPVAAGDTAHHDQVRGTHLLDG